MKFTEHLKPQVSRNKMAAIGSSRPTMCLSHKGFLEEWDQLLMFTSCQFCSGLTALQHWLKLSNWCPVQVGHLLCGLLPNPSDLHPLFTLVLQLKEKINLLDSAEMGQPVLE